MFTALRKVLSLSEMSESFVVNRFSSISSSWNCNNENVGGIEFKSSCDIRLMGIGLYGNGSSTFSARVRILDDHHKELASKNETYTCKAPSHTAPIKFDESILIRANTWYSISATISGFPSYSGTGGKTQIAAGGVQFEFRNSSLSSNGTDVTRGQIPEIHFELVKKEQKPVNDSQLQSLQSENDTLIKSLTESTDKIQASEMRIEELETENDHLRKDKEALTHSLIQSKIVALERAKVTLEFEELEKLDKLFVSIQLENGSILYFDNTKPFELVATIDNKRVRADLKLLEGEFDCSFKGVIGNSAYFSASRGKKIKLIKASILNNQFVLDEINELKTSDLIPFEGQPMYFIEESREWAVYQFHENYEEQDGEKFDISGLRSIRKFDCHYHRGVLYFFRENTVAKLDKLNDKVVVIEGPLSFYTPPHSEFIYIANADQNVLLILNTANLHVEQQRYVPPIDSTYHSIVGVHEGTLTMAFEGRGVGRCLMTAKLSQ